MGQFDSDSGYDAFMGRYSRPLAPHFADFAGVAGPVSVLDVGAGTGALTTELQARGAEVTAVDPSPPFVEALRSRLPGVDARVAPAEELPWPDEAFDAALAQLVVAFMTDAPAGIAEMRRVVRPGGTVAACMWDRDGMELLAAVLRAQRQLGFDAPSAEARIRYRSRDELEGLFADGFDGVQTELLEVECSYAGYDELWESLLGGAGPAGHWVASLASDVRERARVEIHRELGAPAGPFTLHGRAWATRATRA